MIIYLDVVEYTQYTQKIVEMRVSLYYNLIFESICIGVEKLYYFFDEKGLIIENFQNLFGEIKVIERE